MIKLKEIMISNKIKIIYHASFDKYCNQIMKKGILPNINLNWNDWTEKGYVYFNDNPDMCLMWMRDLINQEELDLDDIVIFEVKMNINLLKIDFQSEFGTDYKFKGKISPSQISIYHKYEPTIDSGGKVIGFKKL